MTHGQHGTHKCGRCADFGTITRKNWPDTGCLGRTVRGQQLFRRLPTLATGKVLGSIELAHPLHTLEELLKKTGRQLGMRGWCARLLQGDPQFIRRGC